MPAGVKRKLFTVADYYQMAEAGILTPNDRVELIDGEILEMSPIGARHGACVDRATDLFMYRLRGKATIKVQNPVRLDEYNEPQPDIAIAKYREDYYSSRHPIPSDVHMLFEVADATLRFTRDVKLPIYARLGIVEVWIEDVRNDQLLVFRDPAGKEYNSAITLHRGESISIAAFPEIIFTVDELLG